MVSVTTLITTPNQHIGRDLLLLHLPTVGTVLLHHHHLQHHVLKALDTLLNHLNKIEVHTLLSNILVIHLSNHRMVATTLTLLLLLLNLLMGVEAIIAAHTLSLSNHLMVTVTLLLLNSNKDKVLLLLLPRKLLPMVVVVLILPLPNTKHLTAATVPILLFLHLKHLLMVAHLTNNKDNSTLNKEVILVNKCNMLLLYLNPSLVVCLQV